MTVFQRGGLAMMLVVIAAILIIGVEDTKTLNWIQWFLLATVTLGLILFVAGDA